MIKYNYRERKAKRKCVQMFNALVKAVELNEQVSIA